MNRSRTFCLVLASLCQWLLLVTPAFAHSASGIVVDDQGRMNPEPSGKPSQPCLQYLHQSPNFYDDLAIGFGKTHAVGNLIASPVISATPSHRQRRRQPLRSPIDWLRKQFVDFAECRRDNRAWS